MLVSHRKKFIYTKTYKTAGTSLEVYFEPYCVPEGHWSFSHHRSEHIGPDGIVGYRGLNVGNRQWYNHMPARRIRELLGESVWNEYFKFCAIRDPFDKLVSAFYFREARNAKPGVIARLKRVIGDRLSGAEDDRLRFRQWLKYGGLPIDRQMYSIDGKICVDYFVRYENLSEGIRHVCQTLNLPFQPEALMKLKSGLRPARYELGDYYDRESIGIVSQRYEPEMELFGYRAPEI